LDLLILLLHHRVEMLYLRLTRVQLPSLVIERFLVTLLPTCQVEALHLDLEEVVLADFLLQLLLELGTVLP
jgi:hypothetical protein